jgi:uncharacterized protein (DUF2267 family)
VQYSEFVKHVQTQAGLAERDQAARVASAVITTLSQRLAGNEAAQMLAQLPKDLVQSIPQDATDGYEKFGPDEFVRRVAEQTSLDEASAERGAQAVLATLAHALAPGELRDVRTQFPPEFDALWQAADAAQ